MIEDNEYIDNEPESQPEPQQEPQPHPEGLQRYCRYFGTPEGSERNTAACFYEERWVKMGGIFPLDNYVQYGLREFSADDGVPITLKAMLFNRYHSSNGFYPNIAEMFKAWYERFYLGVEGE
ncbi:MAG: hypothetical protein IKR94_07885 [Bacteroidales bacterium]|nr:hypothetical protein [Bacteroidales bacterium]